MMPLRVAIVDDEQAARERLEDLLAREDDVVVVASHGDPLQAIATLQSEKIDLIFLDVQMPGRSGFDVIAEVGVAQMPTVVFTTAYDKYALRAFESAAVDYLLKPFDDDRFGEALNRVRGGLQLRRADELARRLGQVLAEHASPAEIPTPRVYRTRFAVDVGGKRVIVPASTIDYIEAAGVYVQLHVGSKTLLVRERMYTLEEELDPHEFCRIHRSTIVRLDRIASVEPLLRGDCVIRLSDETKLRLSRNRREELGQRLGVGI